MKYTDDSILPEVALEYLLERLKDTAPYTVVVLKAGPNFVMPDADRTSEAARIVMAHGRRNFALREAGFMPIVCPVRDGSGVTGICIFDTTAEDADQIMAQDPGVKVVFFTYDIHPTRAFPGSVLPAPEQVMAPRGSSEA
jgi:hypothetical protein